MFYVINMCPAKNMCATLDILKIFSFKLGAQGSQFVKWIDQGVTRFYTGTILVNEFRFVVSRYKYLSTLVTDILGNEELELSIDWR